MKTDFFSYIDAMGCPGKWQIVIQNDDKGQFTVSTHFTVGTSGDNAGKHIIPFVSTGTAADFDEGYFTEIEKPVRETSGLLSNMEDYLKALSKTKEQSRMAQDAKSKNKAKPDGTKDGIELPTPAAAEEKRKAYTEALRRVIELDSVCRYDEALAILPTADEYPDKEAEINKRKAELERKQLQKANLLFT
jgi:PRTRC genetic system protein E